MHTEQIEKAIRRAVMLGRYLTGKATPGEAAEIQSMKEQGDWEEQSVQEIFVRERLGKSLERYGRLEAGIDDDWKRWQMMRKGRRVGIRRLRWVGVAAAVTVLFGLGGYWLYTLPGPEAGGVGETIAPGNSRAILYSGNRKVIEIEEDMQSVWMNDSSLLVAGHQLRYTGSAAGTPERNTLVVPRGGEFSVVLPDGSKVWLNAATRLSYPNRFCGSERMVELEGEAYFEVRHDDWMPFIVKTVSSSVRVYGTSFNVKAYPDDSFQKTTLEEGSVGLIVEGREYRLAPDEQAVWNAGNHEVEILKVDAALQSAWRSGQFMFGNERLEDIMAQLSRWYDVDIFFAAAELKELHFSGTLDRYEDIGRVLRMIGLTTDIAFTLKGRTVTITRE